MTYWFTGDLHLWHHNIMKLCGRPFADDEAQANHLRDAINFDVGPRDRLVILGDLAMGRPERLAAWLDTLRCKNLVMVWGNHDDTTERLYKREPKRFLKVGDIVEIKWQNQLIVCCHYPMRSWRNSCHGSYHVHGHVHGQLPRLGRSMDVGVDANVGFRPYPLEEVVMQLNQYSATTI